VSAFTTAAHVKFLLLHDGRSDDLVKSFFRDVYEMYLRVRYICAAALLLQGACSRCWGSLLGVASPCWNATDVASQRLE
jgi:hypothetical protein